MADIVVAPPAELVVSQVLRAAVGVPVYVVAPSPLVPAFLQVTRAGGPERNIVTDGALVIVKAWGVEGKELDAERLALLARAHLKAAQGVTVPAGKIRYWRDVGGPAFQPDPVTGRPRYQFTGELGLRASKV